jgi:site-specific recombinase XerD
MAGADLLAVSRLPGHSSVKVTEMYAHLMPGHLKATL